MVGYLIQSCDISHETTHFKLELFASSSFTYEAKIIMLANGFGLEPIPNYQVPCTVSWTAVVLCQAHIGHYPQPFLFFVWCQLGWHLLSVIFCHLPITYQFSFVLLEVHDTNPPPSSSAAAAARWWMTVWQWSCQDLLLYDILNDRLLRFQMATVSFKFLD